MTGDRTFIAAEVDAYEDTPRGAWHNRFRKLLIRFEKRMENYRGLVHFACALIVYRLTVLG